MSSTQLLTIDFETYYDKDFSLSKITTEEYVRSELFEVIGVAVKVNGGVPKWFSGTHQETAGTGRGQRYETACGHEAAGL